MLQSGDADGGGGGAALALQTDHTLGLDAVPGACSQVVQDQLLGTRLPLDPVLQRGEEDGSNGRTLILFYLLSCAFRYSYLLQNAPHLRETNHYI